MTHDRDDDPEHGGTELAGDVDDLLQRIAREISENAPRAGPQERRGGATVLSPGMNFATISVRTPYLTKVSSVRRTHESGDVPDHVRQDRGYRARTSTSSVM